MHEWALAEAIITTASQIAEKEGLSEVTEVKIKVGELQHARFQIETIKAKLKCRVCGNQWFFSKESLDEKTAEAIHFVPEIAHTYIKCPKCGSPDFEILEGRGIWLESVKGLK
jgi:hydrogenase nickel incorporation protein HypA/HybF